MALPYMAPLVYLFICLNSITVYHVLWALAWNKVFIIIIIIIILYIIVSMLWKTVEA